MKKNLQRPAHNKHESKGKFICQQEACTERFVHARALKQHYFKLHNIIIGIANCMHAVLQFYHDKINPVTHK